MKYFDTEIKTPVVRAMNAHLSRTDTIDDYSIKPVVDSVDDIGNGPFYSGEHRCIYDMLLDTSTPTMRVRVTLKKSRSEWVGVPSIDYFKVNNDADGRAFFVIELRLPVSMFKQTPDRQGCPRVAYIAPPTTGPTGVLITDDERPIITNTLDYIEP